MAIDECAEARDTLVEPALPPPISPNQVRLVLERLLELETICQQARRQLLDESPTTRSAQHLFEKLIVATYAVRDELREAARQEAEDSDVFLEAFVREAEAPPENSVRSFPSVPFLPDEPLALTELEPDMRLPSTLTAMPSYVPAAGYPTPVSGQSLARAQPSTLPAPPPSFEPPAPPQGVQSSSWVATLLSAVVFFLVRAWRR